MAIVQLIGSLVDLSSGRIRRRGHDATLSPLELRLLRFFVERAAEDLDRDELLREVWAEAVAERAVDAAIRGLRKQIEKDPARPDHILTVHGTGYRFQHLADPSSESSLPRQWNKFVGRGEELFALGSAFLEGAALTTLHGPAGVGKTRLSLRFAATAAVHRLEDGVLFVELAEESDRTGLCGRFATSLGLPLSGEVDPVARVGRALRAAGGLLVILDNAEQFVEVLGPTLASWMEAAPAIRWLVTSQKPIGIPAEHLLALEPLPESHAVRLFEDRAGTLGARESQLDTDLISRVCRRVEGLPLAVELAAARAPALGLEALDEALSRSFELLSRRGWDGEPRHATLHAAIGWSWSLLDESARRALSCCSVFRGGFELSAAQAVLGCAGVAETLEGLGAASLLAVEPGDALQEPRFRLSLPVREFAASHLIETGTQDQVASAHRRWFLAFVQELGGEMWASSERSDADRLMIELPNILAAHQGLLQHDPVSSLAMAVALEPVLRIRGGLPQQNEVLKVSLEAAGSDAPLDLRARALGAWSSVCSDLGAKDIARAALDEAIPLATESGDPQTRAWVLMRDGLLCTRTGMGERGESNLLEARILAREAGQQGLEAEVCTVLGILRENQGHLDEAEAILEDALVLGRASGHLRAVAAALGNLSIVADRRGQFQLGTEYRQQAIEIYRSIDSKTHLATMLLNQGGAAMHVGDCEAAARDLQAAAEACQKLGDADGEAIATSNLGLAQLELGSPDLAEGCFRSAIQQLAWLGRPREEGYAHMGLALFHQQRGSLTDAESELRGSIALFEQHGDSIAVVLATGLLALVELELGRDAAARELLEAARQLAGERSQPETLRALDSLLPAFGDEPADEPGQSHYARVVSMALSAFRART